MSSPVAPPDGEPQVIHEDPRKYADDNESDSETHNTDSENSDDDGVKEEAPKVKVSVKELLSSVLSDIKGGTKAFEDLRDDERSRLAGKTGDERQPTALHILAVKEKGNLPDDEKLMPLIDFLVRQPERLLAEKDHAGLTPLYLAISEKKRKMVKWMCQAYDNIDSVLSISSHEKKNCLHVAIEKRVKVADFLVEQASANTLSAKNNDGNTPLHLAVEYKRCKEGQLAIIKAIVDKCDRVMRDSKDGDFNNASLSPYLHHLETCEKAEKEKAEKEKKKKEEEKKKAKNEKEAEKGGGRGRPDSDGPAARDGGQMGVKPIPPKAPAAPLAPSQDKYPEDMPLRRASTQMDAPLTLRKEALSGKDSASGKYGGGQQRATIVNSPTVGPATDFPVPERGGEKESRKKDLLTRKPDTKESSNDGQRSKVTEIRNFLKLHYLRERDHDAALEILYGRNTTSDQAIYFDLSGYPTMTQSGIKKTISILKFEDILQYVAIPKISIGGDSNAANTKKPRGRVSRPDGDGRTDLVSVFTLLQSQGVNTILKVIVDDLDPPAHSDVAIEEALDKRGVEIWNWKKTDLCSEVIRKAAPNVREVHLYWSGNNAVLRGWSEAGGLPQLTQLKTVQLHVQQGLEKRARTLENVADFNSRMAKLCPHVHVNAHLPEKTRGVIDINGTQSAADHAEQPPKHEWIQCMKEFKQLLFDAEKYLEVSGGKRVSNEENIVVALIDDGINVNEVELSCITGRSFCPRNEDHNLNFPYYLSSGGHGTIMASQIHRICPRAELYVLKLEDYTSESSTRQITLKSAAQAIRAAVRKKVHIISMSWTIDPPEDENQSQDLADLESAISDAAKANILMFCSASDEGAKHTSSYPSRATNKIFTIGAADASGAVYKWVGGINSVDFIFPGKLVEGEGPSDAVPKNVKYWTGSSVATALAAALAALILYCAQVRVLRAPAPQKEKARKDFQALKKHDKMMQAFKNIGATQASKYKYLTVWEVFGRKVSDSANYERDKWIDLIAEVGDTLCMKI